MTTMERIKQLRAYLEEGAGEGLDADRVGLLLFYCWGGLRGSNETRMRADKLRRIEQPIWKPPFLEFSIERHGQTVQGSTRATLYLWRVDLDRGEASIIGEKKRQLHAMDKRLDVKPLAESLADSIINGKEDARIARSKDGSVRLKIGEIIPATNNQTTAGRRSRLRKRLSEILAPYGWKELRTNAYHQTK
jgi:hypothetical protein